MADYSVLQNDLQQLAKLDPKKKMVLVGLFFFIFLLSIIVGRNLTNKQAAQPVTAPPTTTTNSQNTTVPTSSISQKPKTMLSITSTSKSLSVGKPIKLSVLLSKVPVTAADIALTYDPKVLVVSDIQNGVVFDRVIRKKIDNGSVLFSASVNPAKANNITEGIVFSFMVNPLHEATSTAITFDATNTITALNGENTLGQAVSANFNVVK